MIFRLRCFFTMWLAFTKMAWGAAFSDGVEFTKTDSGFSIHLKEPKA